MTDLELTPDDIREVDGLLNLVLEGMQSVTSVPEVHFGSVLVGPTFASIVFPSVEVPVASSQASVAEQTKVAKANAQVVVIEKAIRDYTYQLGTCGCPLMARSLVREKDQLVQSFQLVPNDPIGAERAIRKLNLRLKKTP